jgi:hypothetical protein
VDESAFLIAVQGDITQVSAGTPLRKRQDAFSRLVKVFVRDPFILKGTSPTELPELEPVSPWALRKREFEKEEKELEAAYIQPITLMHDSQEFSRKTGDSDPDSDDGNESTNISPLGEQKIKEARERVKQIRLSRESKQEAQQRLRDMEIIMGIPRLTWMTSFGNLLKPALKGLTDGNESCRLQAIKLVHSYVRELDSKHLPNALPFIMPLLRIRLTPPRSLEMPQDIPDHYFGMDANDTNRIFFAALEEQGRSNLSSDSGTHASFEFSEELRSRLYHLLEIIVASTPNLATYLFEIACLLCYGVTDSSPGVVTLACRGIVRLCMVCPNILLIPLTIPTPNVARWLPRPCAASAS